MTNDKQDGTSPQESAAQEPAVTATTNEAQPQAPVDERLNMFGMSIDVDPTRLRLIVADLKLTESKEESVAAAIDELERIAGMFEKAAILRFKAARGEMSKAPSAESRSPLESLSRILSAASGREVRIIGIGPDGPPLGVPDDCECPNCVARRAAQAESAEAKKNLN